jgi:N-acetylglucosamine malate deacetylase 1
MKVSIVAAHPDDEVLGCGGIAARHADDGDQVNILILAEGATSRKSDLRATTIEQVGDLQESAKLAADILGCDPPEFGGLPDNRMDSLDLLDIVRSVEDFVHRNQPELVYTHHASDVNVDHRITHQAVVTACRPLPTSCVRAIYTFETVSSTEWGHSLQGIKFQPLLYIDITKQLPRKLKALGQYSAEMRPFPHARSLKAIEALATLRGSETGFEAAEAFGIVYDRRSQ